MSLVRGRTRRPAATGLRRPRLIDPLVRRGDVRVVVVLAPAGCGKTTLLAQVADQLEPRVAWLTADEGLDSEVDFLAHLRESASHLAGYYPRRWANAAEAVEDLDGALPAHSVLVLDELHTLASSSALRTVRLLLQHQPRRLTVLLGARRLPELDLARQRMAELTLELGPSDLRFRTWEVEELFRICHDVRLHGEEVPALARRTAGWAAGLQLFHLATAGRPPSARARLLSRSAGPLTSRYLTEQVLELLDEDVRSFALRSSALGRMSAPRCDALLESCDSSRHLLRLQQHGLLDVVDDDRSDVGSTAEYRYHDVLHTHLLDQLELRLGTAAARELHRRAATLWIAEGSYVDAVRCSCRAQDWTAVGEVICSAGADLAADRGSWIDLLPPALRQGDPWVALAQARRLLAAGSVGMAWREYGRAVELFGPLAGARTALQEQAAVRRWLDPGPGTVDDPLVLLRRAFNAPGDVVDPGPGGSALRWSAAGVAALLRGQPAQAAAAFHRAADFSTGQGPVEALSMFGVAVAATLTDAAGAAGSRQLAARAAAAGELDVLERLVEGLVRVVSPDVPAPLDGVADLLAACRAASDVWGEGLLTLFALAAGLRRAQTVPAAAGHAQSLLSGLHAPALQFWAEVVHAVASVQHGAPWDPERLLALERRAAGVGAGASAGVLTVAAEGAADSAARPAAALRRRAEALVGRAQVDAWVALLGVRPPGTAVDPEVWTADRFGAAGEQGVVVQVLGSFRLQQDGRDVSLADLRPLHQDLLKLFCAQPGKRLLRDDILDALWPKAGDPVRAQHSLQVAVSELRRRLDRVGGMQLSREGNGYRLVLAPGSCDIVVFEQHLRRARGHQSGDEIGCMVDLKAALACYHGDLLADVGSPEWVLPERGRLQEASLHAREDLVRLLLVAKDCAGAVTVARQGLVQDPTRDVLWHGLIEGLVSQGEPAAAQSARLAYAEVLSDLGLPR